MPFPAAPPLVENVPRRLDVLFDELAELSGQRNAIDGRIVEIIAEIDGDQLCGATGARSVRGVGGLENWVLVG